MPFIRRNGAGEIAGVYRAQQHEGQEFLAEDSEEFKTHLLQRVADEKQRDLEAVAMQKMVSRFFADSPEKITCAAGQAAINAGKDEAEVDRAFQTALKSFQ